jgi:hypothetical protein
MENKKYYTVGTILNSNIKMIFSDSPLVTHHREVKTKTWLIDRQNNVSEWNNMSTCGFISQALRHTIISRGLCHDQEAKVKCLISHVR